MIAFFIIPPAAAYLLSDRLSLMLLIGPLIGAAGAFFGYDLARGRLSASCRSAMASPPSIASSAWS